MHDSLARAWYPGPLALLGRAFVTGATVGHPTRSVRYFCRTRLTIVLQGTGAKLSMSSWSVSEKYRSQPRVRECVATASSHRSDTKFKCSEKAVFRLCSKHEGWRDTKRFSWTKPLTVSHDGNAVYWKNRLHSRLPSTWVVSLALIVLTLHVECTLGKQQRVRICSTSASMWVACQVCFSIVADIRWCRQNFSFSEPCGRYEW